MLHTADKIMSSLLNKMLMNTFYRVWSSCYVKAEFVSKNASVILGIDHWQLGWWQMTHVSEGSSIYYVFTFCRHFLSPPSSYIDVKTKRKIASSQKTWTFNMKVSIWVNYLRNDELSSMTSWVGCLLKDSEFFILFAENNQILLKISVNPIVLTYIYLVALNLLVNNQLNSSSNSTHHCSR